MTVGQSVFVAEDEAGDAETVVVVADDGAGAAATVVAAAHLPYAIELL